MVVKLHSCNLSYVLCMDVTKEPWQYSDQMYFCRLAARDRNLEQAAVFEVFIKGHVLFLVTKQLLYYIK